MNSTVGEFEWWGFDIGGANIKCAASAVTSNDAGDNCVFSVPFPLWKHPARLQSQLRLMFSSLPVDARMAITMTGELADCFSRRQSGVAAIVDAVQQAAEIRVVQFYSTAGHWMTGEEAKVNWLAVAAANWHAIAKFSARFLADGHGFLIDIGSTTTDIIPIRNGKPFAVGKTDFDRLSANELFYAGVGRTPVCNLIQSFQINGAVIHAASEFFATIEDALVITKDVAENQLNLNTADGRPLTKTFSGMRLARMVCEDAERLGAEAIEAIAIQTKQALVDKISASLQAVVQANADLPLSFVVSGQGEWLAARMVHTIFEDSEIVPWSTRLSPAVSKSAAAYAVAVLASEASPSQIRLAPEKNCFSKNPLKFRVIKIGGSLFDWDSTPRQIEAWLSQQTPMTNVWITGGGSFVDLVRDWHQRFPLDEATAHHLCLGLMSVTSRLVASWFPGWSVVQDWHQLIAVEDSGNVVFDSANWLRDQGSLEKSWRMTSDSCAAFIAQQLSASELVLLKSRSASDQSDLQDLLKNKLVDELLPDFAQSIPTVRVVNLRESNFVEVSIVTDAHTAD